MKSFRIHLQGLTSDENGQDVVEYALLAAFLAIVAAAVLINIAPLIEDVFQRLRGFLQQA